MATLEYDLKCYYRSIRSALPCSHKMKNKILAGIENNITDYLKENPDADIAAIVARFGEPQQIASAYVDSHDTPELLHHLRIRKKIVTIVAAAVCLILTLWLAVVCWAAIRETESSDGGLDSPGIIEHK